ncbi:MAG: hypothetical protein K0R24_1165 [Gammaproteobacteria bacterium]|jgi:hypothetical protein|nr:hypothetical protein [Gammaproteobacteria bacterium]MCE3238184.1 hypothetical protein [Gammaproteobacteria bacterium]
MPDKSDLCNDKITKILNDPKKMKQIIQDGITAALIKHKQAGNPVCEWRDNKIVWIPPDQILVEIQNESKGFK